MRGSCPWRNSGSDLFLPRIFTKEIEFNSGPAPAVKNGVQYTAMLQTASVAGSHGQYVHH